MTSFYQFYEHMQESKLNQNLSEAFLTEMPMRPAGSPEQYASPYVSPHASATAKDGYVGRTSKQLIDGGVEIDKAIKAQKRAETDAEAENNPELKQKISAYRQMYRGLGQDNAAASAARKQLGLDGMAGKRTRGGRMVQTNKTDGEEDPESLASKNRGLPALIDRIHFLKNKIAELRPQVQSWYDPKLLEIMHEFIDATTTFNKHSKVSKSDPVAKEIQNMHDAVQKTLDKAKYREPIPQPELNLDDL